MVWVIILTFMCGLGIGYAIACLMVAASHNSDEFHFTEETK